MINQGNQANPYNHVLEHMINQGNQANPFNQGQPHFKKEKIQVSNIRNKINAAAALPLSPK